MTRLLVFTLVSCMILTAAALADDDTVISGFVDSSFSHDVNADQTTFGLDQVELDIEREVGDNAVIRADVEFVKDGDDWVQDLEQGYLAWRPEFAGRGLLTFGKFNAPMGFEMLDAPDMYQYSHALVYDFGLPGNLTGGMATFTANEWLDLSAWWVNGWDDNDKGEGKPKTFGGRADFSLGDLGGIGVSFITGREWSRSDLDPLGPDRDEPYGFDRTAFDIDITLMPDEQWILGGEFNTGLSKDGYREYDWTGLMLMAHRTVNEWSGFTMRFDWFDGNGNYFTANSFDVTPDAPRIALTFAPTFVLGDGVDALLEVRFDNADSSIWTDADGESTDSNITVAFETICSF